MQFQVNTGCKSGNWAWGLDAFDSQGRQCSNGASDLTTNVSGDCSLAVTTQPKDALQGTLVTGTAFNTAVNPVSVELRSGSSQLVTCFPVDASFDPATGPGLAVGTLSAANETHSERRRRRSADRQPATLSIATPNEPQFADYRLRPKTTGTYSGLTGTNSDPFDVWGDAASRSAPDCDA